EDGALAVERGVEEAAAPGGGQRPGAGDEPDGELGEGVLQGLPPLRREPGAPERARSQLSSMTEAPSMPSRSDRGMTTSTRVSAPARSGTILARMRSSQASARAS